MNIENKAMPLDFLSPLRRVGAAAFTLGLIPIPVGLFTAKLLSGIVTAAVAGDSRFVMKNGAILLALAVSLQLFHVFTGIAHGKASSDALHQSKLLLYEHFLSCPLSVLYRVEHGSATEMFHDDFKTLTDRLLKTAPAFFTGIATASVYLGFLLAQNRLVAALLFAISWIQFLPPLVIKRISVKNYTDCRDIEAKITDCTLEYYRGFSTIKTFDLKAWCLDRLAALHRDYLKIGNRADATANAEDAIGRLVTNVLTYGTYGIVGLLVLYNRATLETGVEAIALSRGLYSAVKGIFDSIPTFAVAKAAEKRLSFLADPVPPTEMCVMPPRADIRLARVSLTLGEKRIFTDADTTIPTDGITVIRGANGIGKSTLLKLAIGLIPPDSGTVTLGGADPRQLGEACFPRDIFYLPQEDAEFHLSARELAESVPVVSTESFLSVFRQFGMSDETAGRPIDTLSGGERKKVFLCLAFALRPGLLLLDEPSNSLDTDSRDILLRLLRERAGGTVIITHDSAFAPIADATYTMKEGKPTHE